MQKMSGADIRLAVAEMKGLEGKRISRIRKAEGGIFLFRIGDGELLFQPGVRMHLTMQAFRGQEKPDGFVAYLRKNFEGRVAERIEQHMDDRIVEIWAKGDGRLVFELFRKGNIIAVGKDGTIGSCLARDCAGGREVARGRAYAYPKATPFEIKVPEKPEFWVRLDEAGRPASYSTEPLQQGRHFPSFSQMADFYYANQPGEDGARKAAAEKMRKLLERLASQEKAIERLRLEREEARRAGDAIYANFDEVEKLLSAVRKMKGEGLAESEINKAIGGKKARLKGANIEIEL